MKPVLWKQMEQKVGAAVVTRAILPGIVAMMSLIAAAPVEAQGVQAVDLTGPWSMQGNPRSQFILRPDSSWTLSGVETPGKWSLVGDTVIFTPIERPTQLTMQLKSSSGRDLALDGPGVMAMAMAPLVIRHKDGVVTLRDKSDTTRIFERADSSSVVPHK